MNIEKRNNDKIQKTIYLSLRECPDSIGTTKQSRSHESRLALPNSEIATLDFVSTLSSLIDARNDRSVVCFLDFCY